MVGCPMCVGTVRGVVCCVVLCGVVLWCVCCVCTCGVCVVCCVWCVYMWCVWCVWCVARLGARKPPLAVLRFSTPPCVQSKKPPCVPAKRPHVFNMRAFCVYLSLFSRFSPLPGGSPFFLGNNEHSEKALWSRENHTLEGGSTVFSWKKCVFLSGLFLSFLKGKCTFWSALLGGTPVLLKEKRTFSFIVFHFL